MTVDGRAQVFEELAAAVAARHKGRGGQPARSKMNPTCAAHAGYREIDVDLLKTAYMAIHKADPRHSLNPAGIACEFFENLERTRSPVR